MKSLTLKYRPLKFEDIVGQEVNVRFLSTLIKRGQLGKNLILYGPWGASKTTSVRIYARGLNCQNPTEFGSPCNICDSCRLFLADQYTDYIEVDGATQGGKDKIKDLVKIAQSPPFFERYRVINIDECHNLSKPAWDALLKLIEEPPPYLVFIFTTTEFLKVPETIQSRCHNLEVKLLPKNISKQHLKKVCVWEQIKYEEEALDVIVNLSKGHPRDLIKNLEQVNYFGDITFENTLMVFNLNYVQNLIQITSGLFSKDNLKIVLSTLREWYSQPGNIFNILKSFLLTLYKVKYLGLKDCDDVSFSLISEKDIEKIYQKCYNLTKEYDLNIEVVFDGLFSRMSGTKIGSYIELYAFIILLYNFIHLRRCETQEIKKIGLNPTKVSGVTTKEGREFIKAYKQNSVETEEEVSIGGNGKMYPHLLLNKGFSFKKKTDVNIVTV